MTEMKGRKQILYRGWKDRSSENVNEREIHLMCPKYWP